MPDPVTGAGFDAPSPEVAYMGAPDMVRESAELMRISTRMKMEAADAAAHGRPYEPYENHARLYLLRRAALSDRLSLAHPDVPEFLDDAVQLSQQLKKFDQDHDTHLGPIGPGSMEWDPSARPYVRQEYDHWGW